MIAKRILIVFAALMAAYLAIDIVAPNPAVILASRCIQATVSLVVMYAYWPDATQALRAKLPERGDYLILGIELGFLAVFCQATFSIVWRLAGSPLWMQDADFVGLWINLSSLAGVLHIVAPGTIEGRAPQRNRLGAKWGMIGTVLLVAVVVGLHPDLSGPVNAIRPAFDWFRSFGIGLYPGLTGHLSHSCALPVE